MCLCLNGVLNRLGVDGIVLPIRASPGIFVAFCDWWQIKVGGVMSETLQSDAKASAHEVNLVCC